MSGRAALALGGVIAVSALAWALWPSTPSVASEHRPEREPRAAEKVPARPGGARLAPASERAREQAEFASRGQRAAKQRLLEQEPRALALESEPDFDEARPGPEASISDPISEREQQLAAQAQIEQARRLHAVVDQRAQSLRGRIEQARANHDLDEVGRLELMLRRLEQRGQVLERTASELESEG